MKNWKFTLTLALTVLFLLTAANTAYAAYREYMVFGAIVDNTNTPIPNVIITLKDKGSSRVFTMKTNKKGKFKYAGLPHAIYAVTMEKKGYQTKTDEWALDQKQNRMQKVDYHTIVLLSDKQHHDIELGKELKKNYDKAKDLLVKKDHDGAIALLTDMDAKKPDQPPILYLLGTGYLYNKNYEKALPIFVKVTQLDADFPGGFFQLGVCYQKTGKLEPALDAYKAALKLEPGNQSCLYNCGTILYRLEKNTEAIPYFLKVLEKKATDAEVLELTGLCYLKSEQFPKALEYFEKARANTTDKEKVESLDQLIKELKQTKPLKIQE